MKWIEATVIFDDKDRQLAPELISDIFYEMGLQGVVIETTDIEPTGEWADETLKPADHNSVTGYFPKNDYAEQRCRELEKELARLKAENSIAAQIRWHELDEEDWAESWKAYFHPQKISKHMVVKPTWREYEPAGDEIILEIDPGMAFGTGTHATTSLCIRMMEDYLKPGDTFLDVGTGSGILMIAAAKLGACKLCGTDSDEVAVEVARQNLLLNSIAPEEFTLITGNLTDSVNERFDLVTANILSEVILVLLDDVKRVMKNGAVFICSGIIQNNKNEVLQKMESAGFEISDVQTEEEWVAIAGKA
jgi:ribosomal protein L11 methyltransferase